MKMKTLFFIKAQLSTTAIGNFNGFLCIFLFVSVGINYSKNVKKYIPIR